MKASIKWNKNGIAGGLDDPHRDTIHEGFHACILVDCGGYKFSMKTPEFEYGERTYQEMKKIVEKINS